ncbi:MAG TPA: aquaporin [Steroidobacteraceae bacterium]|nr:aquaporin [Steroidobacteraceae bacterium]
MNTQEGISALRGHWPEYLIEGWALGMFMISAGLVTTLFDYPGSPVNHALRDGDLRRVLIGICMGLTAMALIYSPWGRRSGAHMNPAVTLTFLRLGHVAPWDAMFYILAQFLGGTLGVLVVLVFVGDAFAQPPVRYVATLPGMRGVSVALLAEFAISFAMMTAILRTSNSQQLMRYTGVLAGVLVATWISVEGPLSGMSMNPARTFASALPGNVWTGFWLYMIAPVAGMQAAAALFTWQRGRGAVKCSKLIHAADQRCIHCGYEPSALAREAMS